MRVAVIILAYNGIADLPRCVASVVDQEYPKEKLDVIVVDNASHDGSADLVAREFPNVHLIRNDQNLGFAGGNNVGIRAALERGADAVVFLNQDTYVARDWISELVRATGDHPEAGMMQSGVFFADDEEKIQTLGNPLHFLGFGYSGRFGERRDERDTLPRKIGYASGASMLVRRGVIERIGMLNDGYFLYHEDLEWSVRARLVGYEVMVAPAACTFHRYEFSRNKKKWYWMERNRLWYVASVYRIPTLILLAPAFIAAEIGVWCFALSKGWFVWKLKSVGGFFRVFPQVLRDRNRIQKMRVVSDRELTKCMTDVLKFDGVTGPLIRIANIPFRMYWTIVKRIIFW